MSDAEFGQYMRMLILQWIEGQVPVDAADAATDAGCDEGAVDSIRSLLDRKFPPDEAGTRQNERLAQERSNAVRKVEVNRANGSMGGRSKANAKANGKANATPNGSIRASVSDSDSSSLSLPPKLDTPDFRAAWDEWYAYRRESGLKKYVPRGAKAQLTKLEKLGHDNAIAAIKHSITECYHGIYPPKSSDRGGNPGSTGGATRRHWRPDETPAA